MKNSIARLFWTLLFVFCFIIVVCSLADIVLMVSSGEIVWSELIGACIVLLLFTYLCDYLIEKKDVSDLLSDFLSIDIIDALLSEIWLKKAEHILFPKEKVIVSPLLGIDWLDYRIYDENLKEKYEWMKDEIEQFQQLFKR